MSDIKFACPHCQQHIQCEPAYAGMQIPCPACKGQMVVPGTPAAPAPAAAAAVACPGCGAPMAQGAILCTSCGYNVQTGQRLQPRAAAPPAAGRPTGRPAGIAGARAAARAPTSWYQNPNVWLGVVLAVLGIFYALAWTSPMMVLVYLGVQLLYSVVVGILVLIAAFKESAGTGFMTLCIPCYSIYFVYFLSENPTLKALYSVMIFSNIASAPLKSRMGVE